MTYAPAMADDQNSGEKTAYDFSFTTLMGEEPLPLSKFKGKLLLVVNTASHCGFTPQYRGLQELYSEYADRGFVILGVPSNDFGAQEPGNSEEISKFCKLNYGVTFPMASKQVVSGDSAHPFYLWARSVLGADATPKWNFHKILINKHGKPIAAYPSTTAPDSATLVNAIENHL